MPKSKKAVRAKDVVFATLIHDEEMMVVAQQGVVLLQSQKTGKPYLLPAGLSLPASAHGQKCDAIIRDLTGEVITERGKDDIYEEELSSKKNDNVMPVDAWDDILTLMDELKLESITRLLSHMGTIVSGLVLGGVSNYLYTQTDFGFPMFCIAGIVIGLVTMFYSLYNVIKNMGGADSKIIRDAKGNYINLDTGKTNLNGGMTIPIKQR